LIKNNLSVIIPAYNEEGSIYDTISDIINFLEEKKINNEIIVVDDGSTDNTKNELQKFNSVIKVIRNVERKGYGYSLLSGISKAVYEYVAIIDADGTYSVHDLAILFSKIGGFDMIVGARIGENVHIPLLRKPAKWAISKLANFLAGERIPDLNSGLRIIKKDLVLQFRRILPRGFSFTTTITLSFITNNYRVKYVPINYKKRVGVSKIKPLKDTLNFIQLVVRTIMYFSPLKIFVPLSFFLFLAFSIAVIIDIFVGNISDKTVLFFVSFLIILSFGCLADMIDKRL